MIDEKESDIRLRIPDEKRWENLGISSDYVFSKVMQDKALCLELIRMILPEMDIMDISEPQSQYEIREDMDARGVRFDIFVKSPDGLVIDIEMEVRFSKHLSKRTRYYSAMIDMNLLDKGTNYKELPPCIIIFICPGDPFDKGYRKYTFRNICVEDHETELSDGTMKVFLNARGVKGDISPKLQAFLDLVAGKRSDDDYVKKVEDAVSRAKERREWRQQYMTLLMRDQENREFGAEEAKKSMAISFSQKGISIEDIADAARVSVETVQEWLNEALVAQ